MYEPLLLDHGVVALIPIGVQRPFEAREQPFGHLAGARGVIVELDNGRFGRGAHLRPEVGLGLRGPTLNTQHRMLSHTVEPRICPGAYAF